MFVQYESYSHHYIANIMFLEIIVEINSFFNFIVFEFRPKFWNHRVWNQHWLYNRWILDHRWFLLHRCYDWRKRPKKIMDDRVITWANTFCYPRGFNDDTKIIACLSNEIRFFGSGPELLQVLNESSWCFHGQEKAISFDLFQLFYL